AFRLNTSCPLVSGLGEKQPSSSGSRAHCFCALSVVLQSCLLFLHGTPSLYPPLSSIIIQIFDISWVVIEYKYK
ncbi:MAG TPA: hypothetical protein VIL99_09640, partial [Ignavibacteria bacterium]